MVLPWYKYVSDVGGSQLQALKWRVRVMDGTRWKLRDWDWEGSTGRTGTWKTNLCDSGTAGTRRHVQK